MQTRMLTKELRDKLLASYCNDRYRKLVADSLLGIITREAELVTTGSIVRYVHKHKIPHELLESSTLMSQLGYAFPRGLQGWDMAKAENYTSAVIARGRMSGKSVAVQQLMKSLKG